MKKFSDLFHKLRKLVRAKELTQFGEIVNSLNNEELKTLIGFAFGFFVLGPQLEIEEMRRREA